MVRPKHRSTSSAGKHETTGIHYAYCYRTGRMAVRCTGATLQVPIPLECSNLHNVRPDLIQVSSTPATAALLSETRTRRRALFRSYSPWFQIHLAPDCQNVFSTRWERDWIC
jgi:hypothetical protein